MLRLSIFIILAFPFLTEAACSGTLLGQWAILIQHSIRTRGQKFAKDSDLHVAQQILQRQKTIQSIRPFESRLYPLYIKEWNINRDEVLKYSAARETTFTFEEILADPSLVTEIKAVDLLWLQAKVNQLIIERRFLQATAGWEKRDHDYAEALYDVTRLQNNFVDLRITKLPEHLQNDDTTYMKLYQDLTTKKAKWTAARKAIKDLNASRDALKKAYPQLFSKDDTLPHEGFYPETEEDCRQERRNFIDDYARSGLKT